LEFGPEVSHLCLVQKLGPNTNLIFDVLLIIYMYNIIGATICE